MATVKEHLIYDDSKLSSRARADAETRRQILYAFKEHPREIYYPDVEGAKEFWEFYADGVRGIRGRKVEAKLKVGRKAKPYSYEHGAVLAYSRGAESSLIKAMFPSVDRFLIDRYQWFTNPLDGLHAIIGAGLGYSTTFHGNELENGKTVNDDAIPYYFETSDEFAQQWRAYSGANFLSPVAAMEKAQVVKRLVDAGIKFYSCSMAHLKIRDGKVKWSKRWCRRCHKCIEIYYLCYMQGLKPPFEKKT